MAIEFGKALDATMQSSDVVGALGRLASVKAADTNPGSTIVFDLRECVFTKYRAQINLIISVRRSGKQIFLRESRANGASGVYGIMIGRGDVETVKTTVQESIKSAMDRILLGFVKDLADLPAPQCEFTVC
jgi:hypothetical protein